MPSLTTAPHPLFHLVRFFLPFALVPLVASVAPRALAQTETFVPSWTAVLGEAGNDVIRDIVVDSNGDLITVTDLSNSGAFVIKYHGRDEAWRVRLGGANVEAYGITVDASDNVFAIGGFTGAMIMGPDTLQSAGEADVFVVSMEPNGNNRWSRRYGGVYIDDGRGVAVDVAGNIVITGRFIGTVDFGRGPLVSDGPDCFVVQLDASASTIWSASYRRGDGEYETGVAIGADESRNVYVAVNLSLSGDPQWPPWTWWDSNLVSYDSAGQFRWEQTAGQRGGEVYDLAVDPFGDAIVVGVNILGGDMREYDGTFVSKYGGDGSVRWHWDASGTLMPLGVAADPFGNIIASGYRGFNPRQGIVVKLDRASTEQWSRGVGENSYVEVDRVALDPANDLVLAGTFYGDLTLGDTTYVNAGDWDAFVTRSAEPVDYKIMSVSDVPGDQGGFVNLSFARASHDIQGALKPVVEYQIMRRDESWQVVGGVPADRSLLYQTVAPARAYRTPTAMNYAVYKIRALTDDPLLFFDTPPDSGVPVDNIEPFAPTGLSYAAGMLSWDAAPELDVDHYAVWGSLLSQFNQDAVVIGNVTVPSIDVTAALYPYYFVATFDIAGNSSTRSMIAGEPDRVPPGAPQSLSYDAGVLRWTAPPDADVASYRVYASMVDTVHATDPPVGSSVDRSFDVSQMAEPYYFVSAVDLVGNEGVGTRTKDNLAPLPPANVAYDGNQLTWDPSTDPGAAAYRVYGSDSKVQVPDFLAETDVTSFAVAGLAYIYYHATVVDHAGNESQRATVEDEVVPTPPSNLQVRSGVLSWNAANDPAIQYYDVYGSADAELDEQRDLRIARTSSTRVDIRDDPYPYYAVTTTDAAGNVSEGALVRVDGRVAYPLNLSASPNPFNPATTIRFDLPASGNVQVAVFDAGGRRVAVLVDGERDAGSHVVPWNGLSSTSDPVSSGVYFVRLVHASGSKTLKLVLLR